MGETRTTQDAAAVLRGDPNLHAYFDTVKDGGRPDGNISKDDFELVAKRGDARAKVIAQALLDSGKWEQFWKDRPWNRDIVDTTWRNRGTIATVVATGLCLVPATSGGCPGYQAAAYAMRSQKKIADDGWNEVTRGVVIADGILTYIGIGVSVGLKGEPSLILKTTGDAAISQPSLLAGAACATGASEGDWC